MTRTFSLHLLLSLLAYTLADNTTGHHRHHRPDTAPDMDLKPAFQRTTESPHSHKHDFTLPLPSRGFWNKDHRESHTESYDYESATDYDEIITEISSSGDYETKHDHSTFVEDENEGRDSQNELLASSAAVNKLMTALLSVAVALLLIT